MNQVCLVGRFTRDPKIFGEGDSKVAKWTLACRDRAGVSDFVNCLAFAKKAELAERCVKGTMVTVSGKVKSSTYVQGEIKKWIQEVQVETIEFVNGNCNVEPSMPEDDVPFK
jgi:single-stranded DNA-binding protein